jgi:hypothetical protein
MQLRTDRPYRRSVPVLVAAAIAVAGCSGSDDTGSAAGTSPATATTATAGDTSPVPGPATSTTGKAVVPSPGATGKPSVAISRAPVVKIGKVAKLTDHVEVAVGRVRQLQVKAEHPGEIKGSAAAVQITVKNTSKKPFSLDGLVVTASYGDGLPGDETTSGPSAPLTGSLGVGKSARGTYVFMVPSKYAASLHLEVSSDQSPTIVRFAR